MAVFDIGSHVLVGGKSKITEIIDWLTENVGQYYGRGDDPVIHIGSGWEMSVRRQDYDDDNGHGTMITWTVDITNDEQSIMFALKWS